MSGLRNKAWSREHVTINQVWHSRRKPDEFWRVYQCHHADETIELSPEGAGRESLVVVGTSELRKYWERVT